MDENRSRSLFVENDLTKDQKILYLALELANKTLPGANPDRVIQRARIYEGFLKNESSEPKNKNAVGVRLHGSLIGEADVYPSDLGLVMDLRIAVPDIYRLNSEQIRLTDLVIDHPLND